MTKKKAIEIITIQKQKLTVDTLHSDYLWLTQTLTYIDSFLGKDSEEYKMLDSFSSVNYTTKYVGESIRPQQEETTQRANRLLDNVIDVISNIGIKQKAKDNFIKYIDNAHLAWLIPLLITGLITIGYGWGTYTTGYKNFKLEQDNKNLMDSIAKLTSTPNNKSANATNQGYDKNNENKVDNTHKK